MIPWNRSTVFALLVIILFAPQRIRAFPGRRADEVQELAAKISRERNPVNKAKDQLKLAHLTLVKGIQAYDANAFAKGRQLLREYLQQVQGSWQTLQASGRNAVRSPQGFKELDISLRENGRLLRDLRTRVPYPENRLIEEVESQNSKVRDQVLDALFPGLGSHQRPQSSNSHRGMPRAVAGATT